MSYWQHYLQHDLQQSPRQDGQASISTLDASRVRLVATDMDGTLTRSGRFSSALLQDLEVLALAGIPVLVVTGRSAGWVSGLLHYLPIVGAIAENGGIYYSASGLESDRGGMGEFLVPLPDNHRERLSETFKKLQQQFPYLQESPDNRFRLTDWTFDVAGLSQADLKEIDRLCQLDDYSFTYSTVQCHIKPPSQNKAAALHRVLSQHFSMISPESVVTVGDSPNDETLFTFPLSVGVANLNHYVDQLVHLPNYWTDEEAGIGFGELVKHLTRRII